MTEVILSRWENGEPHMNAELEDGKLAIWKTFEDGSGSYDDHVSLDEEATSTLAEMLREAKERDA